MSWVSRAAIVATARAVRLLRAADSLRDLCRRIMMLIGCAARYSLPLQCPPHAPQQNVDPVKMSELN